ncbi:hypothetical protein CRG98_034110 [Punica granatum]|uniref:Uncharacterized protein n=1 Tax=Punica granatum TaxID=22663 RepID=A0A2I0IP73_PUNGR|nr:hypothetical protein CRG98_034110 [Punica granatum]
MECEGERELKERLEMDVIGRRGNGRWAVGGGGGGNTRPGPTTQSIFAHASNPKDPAYASKESIHSRLIWQIPLSLFPPFSRLPRGDDVT